MHSTSYEVSNPSSPLSDFNSDSSDEYREKFDNLKVLVRELQKQIKSQRVQGDTLHTLNTCLDEERRENTDLREQIKKLEHVVTVLRKRLLANRLSVQTEFEASDPLIITPSKQLLDNLVQENTKLQEKLKYLQVDPVKLEQLYKEKRAIEEDQQEKIHMIDSLSADNHQLRATLAASTDDKGAKIVELQREVNELKQSQDTQDIICQSLSDETITLKERLRATAEVCQHLARQLERSQMSTEKQQSTYDLGLPLDKMTMSTSDENGLVVANERLQLENLAKDEEIKKLEEMNKNWQLYTDTRNNEMMVLQRQLEETMRHNEGMSVQLRVQQQEKMDQLRVQQQEKMDQLRVQQQEKMDQLLLQYKQKADMAEEARFKADNENQHLRSTVELCERQLQQQNDMITSLKQQVQALADANIQQAAPCNHETQTVHLEAQLKVYREDFECERRDREAAQSNISELQNELSLVKRQHQMVARGLSYQCDAPGNIEEDGEDEIDGAVTATLPTEEHLQCPSCKKEFPISRHSDLLEHIDDCCE
ncbi:hypothetical protein LSAT2_003158 [Lamellibrachia satsuma]|nr:hypothetical protein LSAT2_003158 [Lamellibrachia satsuma]